MVAEVKLSLVIKPIYIKTTMAAGILLAAIVFYAYNPATENFFPACPFLSLTGFLCPGCGSQRALHQLLHGNFLAALQLNALLVISVPLLLYHQVYLFGRHFN